MTDPLQRKTTDVTALSTEALTYRDDSAQELIGYLVSDPDHPRPGVLLIHDAFGVSAAMKQTAERIAALGVAVLLADLWGGGRTPASDDEIGPLIGSMVSDHDRWMGRIKAGHDALLAQPGVAAGAVTAVGYCFGGSSALEYLRHGHRLGAVVTFHAGLDTVGTDWSQADSSASVLVLTGAEDPMASPDAVTALQEGLSAAGVDWEVAVYGHAKHGFTNPHSDQAGRPDAIGYDAHADRRSWQALAGMLEEVRDDGVAAA